MSDPIVIDTVMHNYEAITAAYVVQGEQTALLETGPRTSVERVREGLREAGIDHLDWIVVTHIHLDHAGAAGTLAADFPAARVAVHGVGAPHLVDPSKLWSSATRIYGDDMERLWGGIDPIPEERIRVIEDGDKIDLGGRSLQAIETSGHAYHHHAYLDDLTGILFTGDALGVRLRDVDHIRPATPPPEFHLSKALASIDRLRQIGPEKMAPTHFGPLDDDIDSLCDEAIAALRRWGEWVRDARRETDDLDRAAEIVTARATAHLEERLSESDIARMEQTTSYRMNVSGYMRYFDKAEQASGSR